MKVNIISEAFTRLGIFIITTKECVYCADPQGHVRWMRDLTADGEVTINKNTLMFLSNGKQKTFDIFTGQDIH